MRRVLALLVAGIAVVTVLVLVGDTKAGQFKRLTRSNLLPVNGQVSAHASPRNQGTAMEIDVYEWQSASVQAQYRCRILSNTTGRELNLRLIAVNGSIAASCAAPSPGTCDTATLPLAPNLLFQCTVSTAAGAPVSATAHYIIAVQRL